MKAAPQLGFSAQSQKGQKQDSPDQGAEDEFVKM